jgi:hypothetical protein
MFELIVIAAVMVFIVSRLDARHFEEAKSRWGLGAAPFQETRRADTESRPRLQIEGTRHPMLANLGFVKGFGVNPQRCADVRLFATPDHFDAFPERIHGLLAELHREGRAVGSRIMELMFHGRQLADHEAVYFTLIQDGGEPHVVAFVDRVRPA